MAGWYLFIKRLLKLYNLELYLEISENLNVIPEPFYRGVPSGSSNH